MHKIHYSHQQSPSATPGQSSSPLKKTQLVLKQTNRTITSQAENAVCYKKKSKTTMNAEIELKKQIQVQNQQYKELALKYELSIQEIQKYQMIIERNNQKRNHEKQQLLSEISMLKKQLEQRSKSQIDLHENGILGHLVNEVNQKAILMELSEYKDKCKQLLNELDTKNLQLDQQKMLLILSVTKKLINTPSCQELINQVQELTKKVNEQESKLLQYEMQLDQQQANSKSKFLFRGSEYFNKKILDVDNFSSSSNIQSTMSNQNENSSQGLSSYIKF
ncbi:unnamed protein product (macronuclear) [Paramecium tetraurelia]|uniref:Lebercilin domain-containing protein n=1 Tax=Paramecium tetraurelia TaxID=5888 RepID=A0CRK5_PARTE|nr:uncharacterized protein GSPATT00009737001 [Paramecium tetraurelia]CAK73422.1 unnamed protein product [Paramecium tetraurelia]|eukprot:XP_001440819.1 hypothetical protein (macronuclear) [Paramecium tetraurelia strain d4-2]